MSNQLWTPGMAGPLEELVERIHRRVQAFARDHDFDQAEVEVELLDGELHKLVSLSAEPGFGFVTIVPHGEQPEEMIVPLGAIRRFTLRPPEADRPFGFSLPLD